MSVVVAESIFGKMATQRYAAQTQAATLGLTYYASLEEAKAGARQALQAA